MDMIPKSIIAQDIRRIEITTNRLVTDVFAGQYKSTFKGRGMEFDEVREYMPGDDIRFIDWNVTARMGTAYIKKFIEERELTVMILVDASASCRFGMVKELKNRLAAEMAGVLSFAAIRNQDKIGMVIFTDTIEKYIPPRKGKSHVLRMIREVLYFQPKGQKTNLCIPCEFLHKVIKRRCVSFIISDFLETNVSPEDKPSFFKPLAVLSRRHDVIAISLNDLRETSLPECGLVSFVDAETGQEQTVDTFDETFRSWFETISKERQKKRERFFKSMNIDHVDIWTHEPFIDKLVQFFETRKKRR